MKIRWKIAQQFEIWWWRQYLRGKTDQEYLSWKKNYWKKLLDEKAAWPRPGDKVLDAGCGPAGVFTVLGQFETMALDPLLDAYSQALGFPKPADFPSVRFIASLLEDFQSPASFDRIYCLNAINHVADMGRCLQNLHRATSENGRLYLTVDAHNHSFFLKLFRSIPGDILHPQQHDLMSYARCLAENGWDICETFCLKKEFFFSYYWLELAKRPDAG